MDEYLPNEEFLMKYLDEELSSQEKASLEDLLKKDEALRHRLENLRLAKEAVRYYGVQSSVANVRAQWEQSHPVPTAKPKAKVVSLKKLGLYGLAAACILFVVIGKSIFFNPRLTPEQVYQEAYVDYKPGSTRSTQQSGTPITQAYQQNNYSEVIRLSRIGNLTSQEQLLTALAFLKEKRPEEAIPYLETLQSNTTYHQDSDFYLALAYLEKRQYNKSLDLLRKIQADPNHLYHQQVDEKIIKEVERLQ